MKKKSVEERVEALKIEAQRKGLLDNLLFSELLDEFGYQTNLLERLRTEIDSTGIVEEKTYVKGAPNTNPNRLISVYNATANARVNTVSAIAKIVKSFDESKNVDADPLASILDGESA